MVDRKDVPCTTHHRHHQPSQGIGISMGPPYPRALPPHQTRLARPLAIAKTGVVRFRQRAPTPPPARLLRRADQGRRPRHVPPDDHPAPPFAVPSWDVQLQLLWENAGR